LLARLLGFEASHRSFGYDLGLDVSDRGRAALARAGVHVMDRWPASLLDATGQEAHDGAVSLPLLRVGATTPVPVYLPVLSVGLGGGLPPVEFELRQIDGGPP
jgi:hypothetical protein